MMMVMTTVMEADDDDDDEKQVEQIDLDYARDRTLMGIAGILKHC